MAQTLVVDKDVERSGESGLGGGIVALLALAIFINYVDRGNLPTAASMIRDELKLSGTQVGLLLSAFFWTYAPGQILSGWLAEKINAYRTLALGLAVWSLATVAIGLANGFVILLALRLLLGLGESAAFPCSSKLLAQHLPRHRLGAANGLIGVGLALGPAFGTLVGGLSMARWGWRPTFFIFGLVSALWLIPWLLSMPGDSARSGESGDESAPSFLTILKRRDAWGAGLGHFSANYAFYFVISWLPFYLVKARGFTVPEMAELGGLIYVIYAASAWSTGWLSDFWMRAGASSTRVRKTFTVSAHVGLAICMLACAMGGPPIAIASLVLSGIFFGFNTPTIYAVGQTLGGRSGGGKWVAFQNCVGNMAGIVAPLITGIIIDRTGQFVLAFLAASIMALAGVVGWGIMIRRVEPVTWVAAVALEFS